MKAQRLRNEIMEEMDDWIDGVRKQDKTLTREHLEHWLKGNNYLSDVRFQFVDLWIRQHRNSHYFQDALRQMAAERENKYRESFVELYGQRHEGAMGIGVGVVESYSDCLLASKVIPARKNEDNLLPISDMALSGFRQILICVRDVRPKSALLTVCYLDNPISDIRRDPDRSNWVICYGYLTLSGLDPTGLFFNGVMHLFRPAFELDAVGGTSVSEAILIPHQAQIIADTYSSVSSQIMGGVDWWKVVSDAGKKARRNNDGPVTFTRTMPKFDHIHEFVKTLTNGYLIW